MPTTEERVTVHETGHAFLTGINGNRLLAVNVDLQRMPKGGIWTERVVPHDYAAHTAAENLPVVRQEVAILLAGSIAESVCFPDEPPDPEWSEYDLQQVDRLLIYGLAVPEEFELFCGTAPAREVDWPGWGPADEIIAAVRQEVTAYLAPQKAILEAVAARIRDNGFRCWGSEFHAFVQDAEGF
jgi:hypothetical protein